MGAPQRRVLRGRPVLRVRQRLRVHVLRLPLQGRRVMTMPTGAGGASHRPEAGTSRNAREEELLRVIKAEFPHLRVVNVHGGVIALPVEATLTAAPTLGRLLEKLRGGVPIG